MTVTLQHDPRLDLIPERVVDVAPELVWAACTVPEHVKKWFTPVPWKTVDCEIDLRPGGIFRTVMRSPEGQDDGAARKRNEIHRPRRNAHDRMGFSEGWGKARPRSAQRMGRTHGPSAWTGSQIDACASTANWAT